MEVILLEKVDNLGDLGDQVKVKGGFARNFLLPQGKATRATPENVKVFQERRAELERAAKEAVDAAQKRRDMLEGKEIKITAKAGEGGKLFGSISAGDIADALNSQGIEVEKKEVRMPEGPIRVTGEYELELHLHSDIDANIKVLVEAE